MEIPRLDFLICNRGAAVVASATDWRPRVYENQRESHSARSVRLWEVAVPKMKINHEATVMKVKQKVAWHVDAKPHYP
jgi:hypothetical protein